MLARTVFLGACAGVLPASAANLADPSPTLQWHTFLGGATEESGNAVAADALGNVFVGGYGRGPWGAPTHPFAGDTDGLIVKLNAAGDRQWHAFLGGASYDAVLAVAPNADGDIFVAGSSLGSWGAPLHPFSGSSSNAFVAKLDGQGTLLWHTFLGATGAGSYGVALALEPDGGVALLGTSGASWGLPRRAYAGGGDAFVARLDASGALLWNTFLGGTTSDSAYALAADDDGGLVLGGASTSSWGAPVRPFAPNSEVDALVARIDASGYLVWNTFLGGKEKDIANGIALDSGGDVLVAGRSGGDWGAPRRAYAAGNDAFVAKLDAAGGLRWSTFLGGSGYDFASAVATDDAGNVYATGGSTETWGNDPSQSFTALDDVFVAGLDTDGGLLWNTFLGGTGNDDANALAFSSGALLVAGFSDAGWGSPVHSFGGVYDALVAKLALPTATPHCVASPTTLCIDDRPGDRRFAVRIDYHTSQSGGRSGAGQAIGLSGVGVTRGGLFWFFDPTNPELLIKVLDGCSVNHHYWVFYSAGTNVGLTLTVTDVVSGLVYRQTHPDLHAVPTVQSIDAFPCS